MKTFSVAVAVMIALGGIWVPTSASHAQSTGRDPPHEVGRVALLDGTVSYHTADENYWQAARRNYPVTTGESFWAEPNAHAAIEIAENKLYLDSSTELDVATLNDHAIQLSIPQGAVLVDLRSVPQNQSYQINIARAAVTLNTAGRYEIIAGDTEHDSQITVFKGSAHIAGNGFAFDLPTGKTALLSGEQTITQKIEDAGPPDAFVTWVEDHEGRRPGTPPKVASRMTGAADLAAYGHWARAERYGDVWYPNVQAGWTPYREGYWSWVSPWGWTWIDDEEWGFAPFHYGRWCLIDDRWAWVPSEETITEDVIPVYAPALVVFFDTPEAIAWVPLGPNEVYVPPYPVSQIYLQQINVPYVRNGTHFTKLTTNKTSVSQYIDARALTAVPPRAMADSRPVASTALPVSPTQLARAKPVLHKDPIHPTALTAGLSPAVARRFGIRQTANGVSAGAKSRAPGPPVRTVHQAPNAPLSARPALAKAAPSSRTPAAPQRANAPQRPTLARPTEMHHLPGSPVSPTTSSTAAKAMSGAETRLGSRAAQHTNVGKAASQSAAPRAQNASGAAVTPHGARTTMERERSHQAPPPPQSAAAQSAAAQKRATAGPRGRFARAPSRATASSPSRHAAPAPHAIVRRVPPPRLAAPPRRSAVLPRTAVHRPTPSVVHAPARLATPSRPRQFAPQRAMVPRASPRLAAPPPHAAPALPRATFGQAPSHAPAPMPHAPGPTPHAAPAPHGAAPAPQNRGQRKH